MIGQALYLAAEAAGVRGTGIGCYFDDVLHRALGLAGHDWQSLYHFTIGGPVEDLRLRTVPPYAHAIADELTDEGKQQKIIGVIGRAPLPDPHFRRRLPA